MTVTIAHSTHSAREQLKSIFRTVNTIKKDLNKCGMRIDDKEDALSITTGEMEIKYMDVDGRYHTVTWKYYPAQQTLKRKGNEGTFRTMLKDVNNFYVTFFPDAKSVLYRIEVNKTEQIRGYIFLLNLRD